MREIKFRAWNAVKGRMVFLDHLWNNHWYLADGRAAIDNNNQEAGAQAQHGQFNVMQFTGLKDKNGKDIYEGDVVEKKQGENVFRYVITFNFGTFSIELPAPSYSFKSLSDCPVKKYEVIGNIYENPNLLSV